MAKYGKKGLINITALTGPMARNVEDIALVYKTFLVDEIF